MTNLVEGQRAPEFTLKTMEGKVHSLESLRSHGPVVAAFFKISCPVCQFTFPFLERLHERFAGDGTIVLGISQDDARETRKFNREYGINFLTLLDDEPYPVSNAYGLTNVPTIFLIDTDGSVQVSCMGFSKSDLERIAAFLTRRQNKPAAAFFRADEIVPSYKPG